MKYILALAGVLVIILLFVAVQKSSDNDVKPTTDVENVANLITQLKPLIDDVSLKNFQEDDAIFNQYKKQFTMIDTLSEQIIDNITNIALFQKYSAVDYDVLRYGAKMDLLSMLSLINTKNEKQVNTINQTFARLFISYIKLYAASLESLYSEKIDVNNYLKEYKEPICSYNQCITEYKNQLNFLDNIQKIINMLQLSQIDNDIRLILMDKARQSYDLYSINAGLYENIEQFAQWEVFRNKYILNDYMQTYLNNLYKYKSVKALKNVYLAKIYMQFMMLDDKYTKNLPDLEKMEEEYPEEFYEESTLFVSGCTNPKYLLEDTLTKCVDFIKNAEIKEDAFLYLEDENMAGFVMIDDILCAAKNGNEYIFYNNDSQMCKALKEKFSE